MKKLFLCLIAVFMCLGHVNRVSAADYTTITGDNTHGFNTYLLVPEDKDVPSLSFLYSIVAAPTITGQQPTFYTAEDQEVIDGEKQVGDLKSAGVFPINIYATTGGAPSVSSVSFSSTDSKLDEAEGITLGNKEKVVVKEVKFNFSSVRFYEPGIYRWKITQTSRGQWGVLYDTQVSDLGTTKERYLDVHVIDNNGTLEVASYVLREIAEEIPMTDELGTSYPDEGPSDKSLGFVNEWAVYDLWFGLEVEGNQGSKDKNFLYTVTLDFSECDTDVTFLDNKSSGNNGTLPNNIVINHTSSNISTYGSPSSLSGEIIYEKFRNNGATTIVSGTAGYNPASEKSNPSIGAKIRSVVSDNYYLNKTLQEIWNADTKTLTLKFGLQDGVYIPFKNLPLKTKYSVVVDEEDYLKSTGTEGTSAYLSDITEFKDATSGTIEYAHGNVYTGYTLTKNGVIPTGIFTNFGWPYVAFGTVGIGVILGYILISKKKNSYV